MDEEGVGLNALNGQAKTLHANIILAMSDKGYMGRHQNEKATQLWRLLLKTGQRWMRRHRSELEHWQRVEDEAKHQRELQWERIRLRNAEVGANSEAVRKEWAAKFDRHVIQPSYEYDHIVFYYEDHYSETGVWREAVHLRGEGDVDRTACGQRIAPSWFNESGGITYPEPQLSVVSKSWSNRPCKSCESIAGPFRVPDRILTARTKSRKGYAVA